MTRRTLHSMILNLRPIMESEINLTMTGKFKMFNHTKLPPPPKYDGIMIRYRGHWRTWHEAIKKWVK